MGHSHPFVAVGTEEAGVVTLLHHDVGDARLVLLLQGDARLPDGQQLVVQHLGGESAPALPSLCRRFNDETSLKVTG